MGEVEREMSQVLSYARVHPPGEWEAWQWHLAAAFKTAVRWALLEEAGRPPCIWHAKKDQSIDLSPDDVALVKEWKTYRHYGWLYGCMIPGGTGVANSPAARMMRDAFPDIDSTADVFERFARAIPPLAHSWASEWPRIMERRPKFPRRFPLSSMVQASSLIKAMGERFPAMVTGERWAPIQFEELPKWTKLYLNSLTG